MLLINPLGTPSANLSKVSSRVFAYADFISLSKFADVFYRRLLLIVNFSSQNCPQVFDRIPIANAGHGNSILLRNLETAFSCFGVVFLKNRFLFRQFAAQRLLISKQRSIRPLQERVLLRVSSHGQWLFFGNIEEITRGMYDRSKHCTTATRLQRQESHRS